MNSFQPQLGSADLDLESDYISNLPTNIKEEVLMKLPIKEAVGTSLLSTKWKNAWMSIPNLVFIEDCSQSKLIRLVDEVLLLHSGPTLQFKLVSRHKCKEAIGRWMLILSRNGIKNLYIELDSVKRCMIPSSFFSCLALEHVHIVCGTIRVPHSLQGFKFLRTLWLLSCKLTGNVTRLISSCPLLESLYLSHVIEYGRLVICAPNLRSLYIKGEFGDLCLETPKLGYANINLLDYIGCYMNFSLTSEDCKSNILRVLGSLSAIEQLQLHAAFLRVRDPYLRKVLISYLKAMGSIPEALSVPFYRLTTLWIVLCSAYKRDVAAAFCLFKSAPNLKMLTLLLDKQVRDYPPSLAQSFWEVEGIEPDLFNCLEIVKILNFEYLESSVTLKYLAMGPIPEVLPVPFYRLTELHIDLCSVYKKEVAAAFCLFKSVPNLKVVFLALDKQVRDYPPSLAQSFWEVEGIEPDLFNCLEIVKILNFEYLESTLNVAKFFLRTAPVLEKLLIMECNVVDSNDVRSVMKKLASFPMLSKMAKVDFVY